MSEESTSISDQIAAMEDDLARLEQGAKAIMEIAAAHRRDDVAWCGERMLEHAEVAYARWHDLFKATSAAAVRR